MIQFFFIENEPAPCSRLHYLCKYIFSKAFSAWSRLRISSVDSSVSTKNIYPLSTVSKSDKIIFCLRFLYLSRSTTTFLRPPKNILHHALLHRSLTTLIRMAYQSETAWILEFTFVMGYAFPWIQINIHTF
jgi:hypothetical protein